LAFPFNVYLVAVVSAWVASFVALPFWRRFCLHTGLVDDPGERKIHDQPIPLAGGLAVMTGLLAPLLVASALLLLTRTEPFTPPEITTQITSTDAFRPSQTHSQGRVSPANSVSPLYLLQYGLHRRALELAGILIGAVGMLLVGLLDDKHELRPGAKFTGQFLIAALVAASGARITLFVPNQLFHYAVTILWILTVINAFNFMDNMNGLCAGLGAIGAWYFAVIAAADGQYLVALIAFLAFGALLGFLPYNFPHARAFLGDAGSHLVGYLLAVLAILPHFYTPRHPRKWAVLIPLLVLAVPLLDMIQVVTYRWRHRRPVYIGDTNHLSHRLTQLGLSRTQAVLVLWLAAAAIGALVYVC